MLFKFLILFIGLCTISCHQATAEDDEVAAPTNEQYLSRKDAVASNADNQDESENENDNAIDNAYEDGEEDDEMSYGKDPEENDEAADDDSSVAEGKDASASPGRRRRRRVPG